MNNYKIQYNGNSREFKTKFANGEYIYIAASKREAVEEFFRTENDSEYYPQEDGSIINASGNLVADADSDTFRYDGGNFFAVQID